MKSLNYDFDTCVGRLFVDDGTDCDMPACIRMFESIDEGVRRVVVIADQKVLGMQEKSVFGGWKSFTLDDG